jgi:hypothetical protein
MTQCSGTRRFIPEGFNRAFRNLFPRRNPWDAFSYPEEPRPMKTFTGQKKLIAGSANRLLLDYCQENFMWRSAIFSIYIYIYITRFLEEPLTTCGTPGFLGTLVGKHYFRPSGKKSKFHPSKSRSSLWNVIQISLCSRLLYVILLFVLYECETWSLMLREEHIGCVWEQCGEENIWA